MTAQPCSKAAGKVVVIGGGLGGLAAAICLAAKGFKVEICEKNPHLGGKLNVLSQANFTFDLGPSIFTLPQVFRETFRQAGRDMNDYVSLEPVRPHWRNFFTDGTVIDLDPDPAVMAKELQKAGPDLETAYHDFLRYSKSQYDLIEDGYFQHGLENAVQLLKYYKHRVFKLSFLTTMDRAVRRRLPNPYLRDIFDFFIKYVGSAATRAPGFMNLMPHIQFGYGLWYVQGGMHSLADGLEKLARELGVQINLETEVTRIQTHGNRADGVIANEQFHEADWVVSNMEAIPAYRKLFDKDENRKLLHKLAKFEPACSGLVIHLGVKGVYENLAHHNFFYSGNQREHFNSVFVQKKLPEDPTIYVVAASRNNPKVAPAGHDNIKILPHIPHLNNAHQYTREDYMEFKEKILDKLERMGLPNLRSRIVTEHVWTPHDIERMYYSNDGSIYGVVSDIWKNYAFKVPRHSPKYDNLYFVGGSVNPGGGMPMVTLSGQLAARQIINRQFCK